MPVAKPHRQLARFAYSRPNGSPLRRDLPSPAPRAQSRAVYGGAQVLDYRFVDPSALGPRPLARTHVSSVVEDLSTLPAVPEGQRGSQRLQEGLDGLRCPQSTGGQREWRSEELRGHQVFRWRRLVARLGKEIQKVSGEGITMSFPWISMGFNGVFSGFRRCFTFFLRPGRGF